MPPAVCLARQFAPFAVMFSRAGFRFMPSDCSATGTPSHLLSYCPTTALSAHDTISRLCAFPCHVAGSAKASPRSGLTFARVGCKSFRSRIVKPLAANRGSRFTRRMETADNAESKLCALITRHTQVRRLTPPAFAPTWKGGNPHFIPLCRFGRHVETVPVSTPFGLRGVVAPSSCAEARR